MVMIIKIQDPKEHLPLRSNHIGDSVRTVAIKTMVRNARIAMATMLSRQRGWTAPRKAMVDPPRANMKAKAAAPRPRMSS